MRVSTNKPRKLEPPFSHTWHLSSLRKIKEENAAESTEPCSPDTGSQRYPCFLSGCLNILSRHIRLWSHFCFSAVLQAVALAEKLSAIVSFLNRGWTKHIETNMKQWALSQETSLCGKFWGLVYRDLNGGGGQLNRREQRGYWTTPPSLLCLCWVTAVSRSLWVGGEQGSVLASDTSRLSSPVPSWLPSAVLSPPFIKWVSVASNWSAEFRYAKNIMLIDIPCSACQLKLPAVHKLTNQTSLRSGAHPESQSWKLCFPEPITPAPWNQNFEGKFSFENCFRIRTCINL